MTSIRCVAEVGAVLGESPLWDPRRGCLWWLDIKADSKVSHLFQIHPGGRFTRIGLSFRLTALAPTRGDALIACTEKGFGFLDPERPA